MSSRGGKTLDASRQEELVLGLDRVPEGTHGRLIELAAIGAHADAKWIELGLHVDLPHLGSERALLHDQARNDADAASQADERKNGLVAGHSTVDVGHRTTSLEPVLCAGAREPRRRKYDRAPRPMESAAVQSDR